MCGLYGAFGRDPRIGLRGQISGAFLPVIDAARESSGRGPHGHGMVWHDERGQARAYHRLGSAWNENAAGLIRQAVHEGGVVLGHFRLATGLHADNKTGLQPFTTGHLTFVHNGSCPEVFDAVGGDETVYGSDSAAFFSLIVKAVSEGVSPDDAFRGCVASVLKPEHRHAMMLTDGRSVWCSRWGIDLYRTRVGKITVVGSVAHPGNDWEVVEHGFSCVFSGL